MTDTPTIGDDVVLTELVKRLRVACLLEPNETLPPLESLAECVALLEYVPVTIHLSDLLGYKGDTSYIPQVEFAGEA